VPVAPVVTDTAVVTTGATGTVQFQVSTDGTTFTQYGTLKTLSGGSPNIATSDAYTPSAAGTFFFRAIYSGDSNYFNSQSGNNDERLVVDAALPTIATTLSAFTITLGQSIFDTATVTGLAGAYPTPTGSVTFWYSPNASTWTQLGSKADLVGNTAVSSEFTPTAPGTYYFQARYSGDANYMPVASLPTEEAFSVTKATPTLSTVLSQTTITLGATVTDTVFVTGLGGIFSVPTGTISFQVSTDNGTTWYTYGTAKTLLGDSATSDSYKPQAAGVYYFRAVYSGDDYYLNAQSDNKAEMLIVQKAAGFSGLTPGFWKNHLNLWQGYSPTDTWKSVFGCSLQIGSNTNPTLMDAISSGGGGTIALARQAVAAILNAEHQYINYPLTKSQIVNLVQSAINSGNAASITSAKNQLEKYNSLEGGIDAHGNPI
jgi:hypothetical protein